LAAVIARYLASTESDDQGEVAMDLLTPELLAEINAVWDANQTGKITVQEASRKANELLGITSTLTGSAGWRTQCAGAPGDLSDQG
jgi:hypothetical protein